MEKDSKAAEPMSLYPGDICEMKVKIHAAHRMYMENESGLATEEGDLLSWIYPSRQNGAKRDADVPLSLSRPFISLTGEKERWEK